MAKKPIATEAPVKDDVLREPAEVRYADQLEAVRQNDPDAPPPNWRLSPRAVLLYVTGGKTLKATIAGRATEVPITRKFFGDDGIVERSVVTLASERALLLIGEPGTGKSWLSEHLAAAISGNSTLTIQGTAGTTEEHVKYSWNIARVIAEGPRPENLIPSPTMVAMRAGALVRFEELTRCVPDVQDALVSVLSDKAVAVPELPDANTVFARPGFNVIATANTRDQGVNELSAALKRRFNYVYIPIVGDKQTEVKVVQQRSAELLKRYNLPAKLSPAVIDLLATVFREIRGGKTAEGVSLKKPATTLSTAEAIGVALDAALHARFFGGGEVGPADVARNLVGAVVKEDQDDKDALKEYAALVAKKRGAKDKAWQEFHDALVEQLSSARAAEIAAGLDPADVARRVDSVLADPLYWFPVRHHSPTAARLLAAVIKARRPKVVFIEGPHEATDLVPFVTDPATVPPVAVYTSYRDDANVLGLNGVASPAADVPARFAAWYPLTAYSPEYAAMRAAAAVKAAVVLIDLPYHAQIKPRREGDAPPAPPAADDDRLVRGSGFFRALADAAGFKSWDEAWDTLFENPDAADPEAYRRELATFCCGVRLTADPRAEAAEGTVERERHFLKVIRETLAARKLTPADALVVCGGFHLFLDRDDPAPPPAPPAGAVYTTVVPYSFFRVSELAGYGAGNRAPQFYQTFADLCAAGRAGDLALEHALAVLRLARRGGDPHSTADAIAVTHHAGLLARLRGRPHPTLDDVHDALVTCCCKGDPADEGSHLRRAMDAAAVGTKIGTVTPKLGRLPIVADFHTQVAALDIGEVLGKEKKLSLRLDKRDELGTRRSAFLHRLRFLGVPFAVPTATGGDFSGTIFREDWQLKWEPGTEPALIEQNLYGDTVETAALARLREDLAAAGATAGATADRLLKAADMDLPDLVRAAGDACGTAIDTDPGFVSLAAALHRLGLLARYADFRGLRRDVLDELLTRCYGRACFALPNAAAVPDDEQKGVVEALISVANAVQRDGRFDRALFAGAARRAGEESPVPFLRGAFLGLLCEIRELPADTLAAEVRGLAGAAPDRMVTAGDLLDGMLAVSRTSVMLGADAIVAAVDELLAAAEWEPFLVMLPRLRAAFERLPEAQRDSFAATVAERYGLAKAADVRALPGGLAATALVARLDAAVAAALKDWPL